MSKYPRTLHLPFSPGTTNDDKIAKDVSNIIGTNVIITEKLDGENCGIEKGGVYARSHGAYTQSPWSVGVRQVHSVVKPYIDDDMMLFGENMEGIHSIEYDRLVTHFYLFGVRKGEYFTSWEDVEFYSRVMSLYTVPVWFKGIIKSEDELETIVNSIVSKPSKLDGEDIKTGEKIMEGIVIRPWDGFPSSEFNKNVFKWVRNNHIKSDKHWTRNWKRAKINW